MTVDEIIRLASLSLSLLISLVGFIIAVVKAIKTKNWGKLKDTLKGFIAKAEEFPHYTGAEKKEKVLSWVSVFCQNNGIKFDPEKVGTEIDEFVALTKQVNQREKDKQFKQAEANSV